MPIQPRLFFLAGIMQGSFHEMALHDQSYRAELARRLGEHFPDSRVYDPLAYHANSVDYGVSKGRETFLMHNRMCGSEVDVLIAFVPEASMGTAIEMWEAWKNHAVVITISPMRANWAIRFLSNAIYPDLPAFFAALESGEIAALVDAAKSAQQ
ncbi:MAG: hypothetical protein FWH27_00975 [Planctomycetaceae bacterium]|nr:hypothetical protein [Planctomycetaceae bacterium]